MRKLSKPGNPQFQPSQFSKSPQPTDGRVTRVRFLLEIVQHLVAMVWPHRDGNAGALHEGNNFFNNESHIRVAIEVVSFVEVAFIVAAGIAQMQEVYVIAQPLDHSRKIVIGSHAIRTCAEA